MKNLRFIFTQLFLCIALLANAVDLGTYYSAASGKKGSALKTALAGIIYKSSAAVSYDGLKSAYAKTDKRSDGKLYDIYSQITNYTPGSAFASTYSKEGDGYNREHLIPQSLFNENSPMKSDLQHVYPSDAKMNGVRNNYCHGNVGTIKSGCAASGNYCYLGTPSSTLTSNGCTEDYVFEPNDEYKGDIARVYFYFVTCYETKISSWGSTWSSYGMFDGTTYPAFSTWAKTMLLSWSQQDQVSTKETTRNEAVYNYPSTASNNRNPFIDFPGLEQYIWGSYTNVAFDPNNYVNPYDGGGSTTTPSISVSPTSTSISEGGTKALSATVSNASGATITWTTSNSSVASLSATSGSSVTVTGVAAGSATITAKITVSGTQYTATCAVTVTSSGGGTSSGDYYTKVTSNSDLTSGQYLIVYEGGNVAFNGGLSTLDATSNTISVTPSNSQIAITSTTEAAEFTIDTSAGTIKSASGLYIGNTSNSNGLTGSSTALTNTISINSGDADIVSSGGAYLRYNATSGQTRFRYYKSSSYSSQQAIQLYKKEESSSSNPVNPTVSFSTSSKSMEVGDTYTQTVTTNSNGSVTYSSGNTSVATVNSSGKVTAVSAGSATITANVAATSSYNAGSASYTVTVTRKTPTLTFATSSKAMTVGDTYTQTATYTGDGTVSYTSSNTSVATVNSSTGLVTAKAAGTTTITATSTQTTTHSSATATYTVTVSAAAVPSITVTPSTASIEVGNTVSLSATKTNASSATITWSASPSGVVSLSNTSGSSVTVTGSAAGTATVTASITVSGTTYTDACTVTVTQPASTTTGSGTADDPYTVADVLQLFADSNVPSSAVYVSGIVSRITSLDTSQYTRARYYISDDGTTSNEFYVYNGLYLNGVNFTSDDQLQVGDIVVVYGTLTTYGTTNEFAANNYLTSLTRPTTITDSTVSFATTSKTMTVGETYTQTATTNSDGDITYSSSNTSVATVDATTGLVTAVAAGTATITASVAATSSYNAGSATYMVTVTRITPTISFATSTVNINEGGTYTQEPTYNGDGAITYSSSNTSVATVDASTGLVTGVSEGTATITATVAATDSYNEGSATYTITVTETGYTYFVKVTSAPSDWSGEYLIVYEDGLKAMDGSLTTLDNYGNSISVSIQNQRIPATAENKAATFTIAPYNSGYSLKSKSGRYIGVGSSSNSGVLTTSTTTAYANTISFSDGDVNIYATYSGGWSSYTYYLRYYDNGTSSRFRYYRNTTGNYKPIALYKRVKVSYQFGDVNMDGNVNLLDVPTLAGYLAGTVSANEIDLTAADVDGSGQISLADLTSLVNLLKNE